MAPKQNKNQKGDDGKKEGHPSEPGSTPPQNVGYASTLQMSSTDNPAMVHDAAIAEALAESPQPAETSDATNHPTKGGTTHGDPTKAICQQMATT